jgi:cell division protein FtsW
MVRKAVDKPFLIISIILVLIGFFIFSSASLGLLARDNINYLKLVSSQLLFGIFLGSIVAFFLSRIHYKIWNKYSFYIFLFAIGLTLMVFIPQLSFSHGGANRWLDFGPLSFQPAEFLKIAFVIYFASWINGVKKHIKSFSFGILPLIILLGIIGTILLLQPDTGTLIVIFAAAVLIYFVAGGNLKHIFLLFVISIIGAGLLVFTKPYIKDRVMTFVNPQEDPLGAGYQIQQSLIAVGSGGIFGRGFGQSVQKFNFLPEPVGDSIFAVFAEEWGLLGSVILIILFLYFSWRGFKIAVRAPDMFSQLTVVGFITLITVQSFINIAAMLGIFPLTGMPLIFISHGGTALLFALAEIGIILNISRYQKIS